MQLLTSTRNLVLLLAVAGSLASCHKKKDKSTATGWNYNDKDQGNFSVAKPKDVNTAPGLVFVQGGTFTMGAAQEDVMGDWNNIPRRITVNSFFIDKTEVANVHYREYLYWLENVFGQAGMDSVVDQARPDTLVWRSELAFNEPYVEYYFRHPSYNYYPVVGVSWVQATEYCKWRTGRVNELALINKGYLDKKSQIKKELNGAGQDNFDTKAYLMGEYQATPGKTATSKSNPLKDAQGRPRTLVKFEDGILFSDYRLPTEAEWEYAAYGYIMQNPQRKQKGSSRGEEVISNKQIYAWKNDGFDNLRYTKKSAFQGAFLSNFKRGAGDNMGVAGGLNDNAAIPAEVTSFIPNGFGLYNMSGNVNEWVADVYRPITNAGDDDFNPYRGNVFQKVDMTGGAGNLRDDKGRIKYVPESDSALRNRRNYQKSYATNYLDGDSSSNAVYNYGITTLISDKSRVYKGGSWDDRAYWLSPGARRFLEEDLSTSTLGFRCAMSHFGAAESTSKKAQNGTFFPNRRNKR
ncbi:SUMF1/EgtB/PvdO family nonheme iron enzyme [Sediminibacterium roseum]|uniref:SUMF1/EgtB/PvdO family nonheme iron enzyme n=1 Tax=Sediminibacterium roseum TaxID=1978412 RepID=A0ABW9ZPJ5_9BACT|nr:SUMF1/EgtB/PvdO family nonheme iron enzyme [Sediminibacterium roseum]NCI49015.1 SUMF1/EgtB/PvdO family nonheme iron enzyme [Sediminibacterium roseum]